MLDVIIVNFRTPELTVDCLRSMEAEVRQLGTVRVWIVENGSGDSSAAIISAAIKDNHWDHWARLKVLERNLGFAGGNNAAIIDARQALPKTEFTLLLNPDTLARPAALGSLLEFMRARPEVGIAGSRLEHLDATVQRSAFVFPTWLSEIEAAFRSRWISRLLQRWIVAPPVQDCPHVTDWVCGAAMLVRESVFEQIGILDDQYFMYFEEVDFCLRAHQAGWQCWYVPSSRVVHLVGQSSGVTAKGRKRRPLYWFAARRHYFLKNTGCCRTILADVGWAAAYAIYRAGAAVRRLEMEDPVWLWWDFVRYNFGGARQMERRTERATGA